MWDRVSKFALLLVAVGYMLFATARLNVQPAPDRSSAVWATVLALFVFQAIPLTLIWFGDDLRVTQFITRTIELPGRLLKGVGWIALIGLPPAVWYVAKESLR